MTTSRGHPPRAGSGGAGLGNSNTCSKQRTSATGASTTWSTKRVTRSAGWRRFTSTPPLTGAFASVRTGALGRQRLVFRPLPGVTVAPGHLKVAYLKKRIKDAPAIDTDGELFAEQEQGLFDHYGLAYRPGTSGERRLARR